jgi:hypothetical protein
MITNIHMISADIHVILKLYMRHSIRTALSGILIRFNLDYMNISRLGMRKIVVKLYFSPSLAI